MLRVCSSSTDSDYTTTAALRRAIFGLTGATATADDVYLGELIRSASEWAESYLGYPLGFQSYTETLAAFGDLNLMVSRTPVRSIINLFSDPASTVALDPAAYRLEDARAGIIQRDFGFDWTVPVKWQLGEKLVPGLEQRPWTVEYTAGYTLAGTLSTADGVRSTGRTLPADIERGVIMKALEVYTGEGRVASKTAGDLSITYRSMTEQRSAESWLEPYRRYGYSA